VGELAWIADAALLERELAAAVRFSPHIECVAASATVDAPLTAVCEGKASSSREAHGVGFDRRPYGQRAIAARLTCDRPHSGSARQWFRSPDVLALLPFDAPAPGASYALVWSVPDARADELLAMSSDDFNAALNEATGGAAGHLQLASERAAWPLLRAQADRWSGAGWVLVGDAYGFLDPLYSSGILLALQSGALAADAIHEGLVAGDTSAARLGTWGPAFNEGMDRMRRLVCEFYDGFNFGKFVRRHPDLKGHITDMLIGDLFNDRVDAIVAPMDAMRAEVAAMMPGPPE
jgi:2-polyprenyl-6-methoxyphenol hydroxylase-like FAD-dependent oxidoreductase